VAWPTKPNAGDLIEDTLLDAIIDALALWGGNVNAAGYSLTGVGSLSVSTPNDAGVTIASTGTIQSAYLTLTGRQASVDSPWHIVSAGNGLAASSLRFVSDPSPFASPVLTLTTSVLTPANWINVQNTGAAPGSSPGSGGYMYAEAGALKWRGSSGTVTTIAPA
jgi:hypothetical protein